VPSHYERMHDIQGAFVIANHRLAALMENLDDRQATLKPIDGAWTAAQIAWHVALSNELLARVLAGEDPASIVPMPDGFQESSTLGDLPDFVETYPSLAPPDDASRTEAATRLRSSERAVLTALRTVNLHRSQHECVRTPFGTLSLYELGACIGAHVDRSTSQIERTIAAISPPGTEA